MPRYSNEEYSGAEKLVVSMDIGTVYTAVSLAHFCPGTRTRARMVTSWPSTSERGSAAKIPTIVSYREGNLKACGAEAIEDLEEDKSNVAVWFKSNLHPLSMQHPLGADISNLPQGVTVERAYSDLMNYLMKQTRIFFENSNPEGEEIWSRLHETMIIIITTPNGWEVDEQAVLRKAVVTAELVKETDSASQVQFVSEGDACVHFALAHRTNAWLEKDVAFAVMDVGGSTVNISVFECVSTHPIQLREVYAGDSLQAGGVFVNRGVEKLLSTKKGPPFENPTIVKSLVEHFETDLKPTFDGSLASNALRFNKPPAKTHTRRISTGFTSIKSKLTKRQDVPVIKNLVSLSSTELLGAYSDVEIIIERCSHLIGKPKYLLLTGGFGESPYLQNALSKKLEAQGTKLVVLSEYPRKAVAEGATLSHIEQFVKERAAKLKPDEKAYRGPEKFVISMDIGTTHTSVSYTHFPPGAQPQSETVTRWPGQTQMSADAKIPSIISYRGGKLRACGEEAAKDLEEEESNVAYWFKLHLHPPSMTRDSDLEVPSLPPKVTIEGVYADMMAYLMENTRKFYEQNTQNGARIWSRLRNRMVIVLSTPNGWDMREQNILRKAAIRAGLVMEKNAPDLIQFVTEAEASVHDTLANHPESWLKKDTTFAVVNAGGSSVDITIYECKSTNPMELREVCVRESVQAGGIFVNREVGKVVSTKIKGSKFDKPHFLKRMVDAFEKDVKPKFDGLLPSYPLKFGTPMDNDQKFGILKGILSLQSEEITKAYSVVEKRIVESCSKMMKGRNVKFLHLLGGFGESPYIQKVLSNRLGNEETTVMMMGGVSELASNLRGRPGARRAPAEAVTISYINQLVKARAARATCGACILAPYDESRHRERRHTSFIHYDDRKVVPHAFDAWVKKGEILEDNFAYESPYAYTLNAASMTLPELVHNLGFVELEVFAWEGSGVPTWCKDENGVIHTGMRLLCTLKANLSAVAPSLRIKTGPRGNTYYQAHVRVNIFFGGTQLHAQLQWYDNATLRRGPVEVIPHVSETE